MDTYLFDTLKLSFIRAHIRRDSFEYEQILARLFDDTTIAHNGARCARDDHYARLCQLLEGIIIMFIENVGIIQLLPTILRDFCNILKEVESWQPSALYGDTESTSLSVLCKHLRLWVNEQSWIPIICAAHAFNIKSEPLVTSVAEMIIRGDFTSIAHADFSDIRYAIGSDISPKVTQLLNEMIDAAQIFQGAAQQLQQMATFVILRIMDPRNPIAFDNIAYLDIPTVINYERPIKCNNVMPAPKDIRQCLEDETRNLIFHSYSSIRSIAPNKFLEHINCAHNRTAEEITLLEITAGGPICATPAICRQIGTMKLLLQLTRGAFIGFDGFRRVIIYGPIIDKVAQSCINICNICHYLGISRNNRDGHIAKSSSGKLFFVIEANMVIVPNSLLPVSRIISLLRENRMQLRAYIENCIWRAIMNFPGPSITSGIIVCDNGEHIYSHSEYQIGRNAMKQVHRDILNAFANDLQFYKARVQTWANKLRRIASIECALQCNTLRREQMTGISAVSLGECVARATQIVDIWSRQLKENYDTI